MHREDRCEDSRGGEVMCLEIPHHVTVSLHRRSHEKKILPDHVLKICRRRVARLAPCGEVARVDLRRTSQLHETLGDAVRLFLLHLRITEKAWLDPVH